MGPKRKRQIGKKARIKKKPKEDPKVSQFDQDEVESMYQKIAKNKEQLDKWWHDECQRHQKHIMDRRAVARYLFVFDFLASTGYFGVMAEPQKPLTITNPYRKSIIKFKAAHSR